MKKRQPKGSDINQNIKFLTDLELHNEPIFAPAIREAQLTGNGTRLARVIRQHMPAIQQYIIELQLEAQKAEADPFYPRPTLDMFLGNVPIAIIPDLFEEQPGVFIMDIGDLMQHTFFCGSPGTGKTRGIISMIKTLKEM